MRALLDTDILLDIALNRKGFFENSANVLSWAEEQPGQVAVAWHSLSNLAYLVRPDARRFIHHLLNFVEVATVGSREAKQAVGFPMNDLEDALQAASAIAFDATFIVTRNVRYFKSSPIPAVTPIEFLKEVGRLRLL